MVSSKHGSPKIKIPQTDYCALTSEPWVDPHLPPVPAALPQRPNVASAPQNPDARAHRILTDGQNADALRFYRDEHALPKTDFGLNDFSLWGVNTLSGYQPLSNPRQYSLLQDANIRGVRFGMLWAAIQMYGPQYTNYDVDNYDDAISSLAANHFTVSAVIDFTPNWANGMRGKPYPPNLPVENEAITLTGGSAVLQAISASKPVMVNLPNEMPFVLAPHPLPVIRYSDEMIATNFSKGQQPQVLHHPLVVGSEEVWIDENNGTGYVKWTRVDNLIQSSTGATHYEIDRSGRVKFRAASEYFYNGKTPGEYILGGVAYQRPEVKIKISYDAISTVYERDVDYKLNPLDGTIHAISADSSAEIAQEEFNNPAMDPAWKWLGTPPAGVELTTEGALHVPLATANTDLALTNYLYQNISGSGGFTAQMKLSQLTGNQGAYRVGLALYQDERNWVFYCMASDDKAGRTLVISKKNGVSSVYGRNGEISFQHFAPGWLTLRRDPSTGEFEVFPSMNSLSGPDGGYRYRYRFANFFTSNQLKVGIAFVGTLSTGAAIDRFLVKTPQALSEKTVRAFYNHLNTEPFTNMLGKLVEHFKDRVRYWEIWNEPDQGWVWRGGQDIYAVLLREASRAIKTADPKAKVISGGYANGSTGNLKTIYSTIGGSFFDYAAWHPYQFNVLPPDSYGAAGSLGTTVNGRQIMVDNGDIAKEVFWGEVATTSSVLASGGGMNERKQAEHAMRLMFYSRWLGFTKGFQWWSTFDQTEIGEKEDDMTHGRLGLFNKTTGDPKPVYYLYKNVASNKGILLDLVQYDVNGTPIPWSRKIALKKIIVTSPDRTKIGKINISTSLTGTDAASKLPETAGRLVSLKTSNPLVGVPLKITIQTHLSKHQSERWSAVAAVDGTFWVGGSVSGFQGRAQAGTPFTSCNGVVSFTLPQGTYLAGDYYTFETFAGDGFEQKATWSRTDQAGSGNIEISLPADTDARYVSIRFERAVSAQSFDVSEIQVIDRADNNIARDRMYIVDGHRDETMESL